MFNRPPFVPIALGFLAVLIVLGIAFRPIPTWWGFYAPAAAAAFSLREEQYLTRFDDCGSAALDYWQQLRRDTAAANWFQAVFRDAAYPAARTYALAGLYSADRFMFDSAVRTLTKTQLEEPLPVLDADSVRILSLNALIPALQAGQLTAIYADTTRRPEC